MGRILVGLDLLSLLPGILWVPHRQSGGTTARMEVVHPLASRGVLAMDILFSDEEDTRVEPPAILPSWELVMIRSSHDTTSR